MSVVKLFFLEGKLIGVLVRELDQVLELITCNGALFSLSTKP